MKRARTIPFAVALLAMLPRPALAQVSDPADALFNDTVLHEIRLSVNSRDLQLIKEHWQEEIKVPADFRWNDQVVRNVSIHSRGQGSRRPDKLSLHVSFDHYTDGQTFLGLHAVILRNNAQDATNMRERLSMLFFRNLGVAASREAHTRLYINNQYEGLYTIVEWLDTDFLRKNFGENTGHLYKFAFDNDAALAGRAPFTFQYVGADPALYVPLPFTPETLKDDPQGEVIARFIQAVSDTGAADWRTNVSAFLDLTKFIRHVAVENFLAEEDGLTGDYGPNNFDLYRFANTTTFILVPWDKSNTFWGAPSPDYSIFRNIVDGPEDHRNLLVLRAFQEPDLFQLYLDTILECAAFALQGATPDQPGWLEAEVDREYDQIHAAALADTILYTNAEFEQAAADLMVFARGRSAAVLAQIAGRSREVSGSLGQAACRSYR
jgi:spore coat protein H